MVKIPRIVDMSGRRVSSDDLSRAIWYGNCGFWTDDWSLLTSFNGIPTCPECGCPGFVGEATIWLGKPLDDYEANHPGYKEFLLSAKNKCFANQGGLMEAWKRHVENRN